MVYFNYQRSIFRTIRRIFKKLVSKILNISYKKVTIILFIVSIILTFLHNTSQASSVNINSVDEQTEAYYSWNILKDRQLNYQRALVLFSINPFLQKTALWDFLKTNIYDKWYQSNTAIQEISYSDNKYLIRAYTDLTWTGNTSYVNFNHNGKEYRAGYYSYTGNLVYISYDTTNNTADTRVLKNQDVNLWCAYFNPTNANVVVTDNSVVDFIEYINSSSADYSSLLENINNSLTSIDKSLVNVSSFILLSHTSSILPDLILLIRLAISFTINKDIKKYHTTLAKFLIVSKPRKIAINRLCTNFKRLISKRNSNLKRFSILIN